MNNKTLAILSYVTIIGWLISFFSEKGQSPKSNLVIYHLKQGFGVFITAVVFNIICTVIAMIIPALSFIAFIGYAFLIFMIFGIINAMNEQEKPVPVIGKMFEGKFNFIS